MAHLIRGLTTEMAWGVTTDKVMDVITDKVRDVTTDSYGVMTDKVGGRHYRPGKECHYRKLSLRAGNSYCCASIYQLRSQDCISKEVDSCRFLTETLNYYIFLIRWR